MVPYLSEDYCPPDVEELKRKGEEALLSEIRNFVMRYNIKQTMIAEMTKMSQAYVSRFFRGDIADMSERTKNTFYMWYLTCKNNPWKLGVKRMVSENGDLIPLKRERFTFKTGHLTVLDSYYERDPYPDAQTREQIVEECNAAVERPDRPLADREKVTLPVVNNWFNNRRKEAKKQLRQQHAQMAAAAAAQESPPPPGFAAALHAMQGWQQQLLQSSATALSAIAGAAAHPGSPPPQPQPSVLAGHPSLAAGMAALGVAPHSGSAIEDDDDDSRGSYSIPEETMAIDFSEGGAAARENRESRDATANISLTQKSNELNIKQEAADALSLGMSVYSNVDAILRRSSITLLSSVTQGVVKAREDEPHTKWGDVAPSLKGGGTGWNSEGWDAMCSVDTR
ncbi:homeodomain-containing DNA- binding protein-like [Tropilaelaps mercedesae]|uniref:Homeodomain-containing DNA-binding protein-like n=1 Tax=Tropilaelaps mercedesae TaxID=418985 RepID=A0A1V9XDR5_9ACAR|nr:homeodomain-containing DNA- binding protein-like [Tropilaelaps mercedesae]